MKCMVVPSSASLMAYASSQIMDPERKAFLLDGGVFTGNRGTGVFPEESQAVAGEGFEMFWMIKDSRPVLGQRLDGPEGLVGQRDSSAVPALRVCMEDHLLAGEVHLRERQRDRFGSQTPGFPHEPEDGILPSDPASQRSGREVSPRA